MNTDERKRRFEFQKEIGYCFDELETKVTIDILENKIRVYGELYGHNLFYSYTHSKLELIKRRRSAE